MQLLAWRTNTIACIVPPCASGCAAKPALKLVTDSKPSGEFERMESWQSVSMLCWRGWLARSGVPSNSQLFLQCFDNEPCSWHPSSWPVLYKRCPHSNITTYCTYYDEIPQTLSLGFGLTFSQSLLVPSLDRCVFPCAGPWATSPYPANYRRL